jgi:hypothetical protein
VSLKYQGEVEMGKAQDEMGKAQDETGLSWWSWGKIILVPVFCYVPAYGLVLFSACLFKPANAPSSPSTGENLPKMSQPPDRKTDISKMEASELARNYIDKTIEVEVGKQSTQAAQDEIDKLKADWKGELFGQISFPVLFAIASIFAAFAVKDILTEILKEQEKEKIKQELCLELENKTIPRLIELKQKSLVRDLQSIEAYMYWLEYMLLNIEIAQVTDDFKSSMIHPREVEAMKLSLKELFRRSENALNRASYEFKPADLNLLRQVEQTIFKAKVNSSIKPGEESEDSRTAFLELRRKSKASAVAEDRENSLERANNVFQVQITLFIGTLRKLQKDVNGSEQVSEIDSLIRSVESYLSDKHRIEERDKIFNAKASPKLPPLS